MKDDILVAQILVDIINDQMDMPDDSVWVRDQNRLIPNDTGLYISVGMVNAPIITGNVANLEEETVDDVTTVYEVDEVQQLEQHQIDVFSRSNDALRRNWEIIAAMQSFYSQQKQEENSFKIFRIPRSFLNTSIAEGGSTLNRYSLIITVQAWYRKRVALPPGKDYYNDFTTRVDDANTIGTDTPLIEFEINEEGIVP
jgi:hypothetical protein